MAWNAGWLALRANSTPERGAGGSINAKSLPVPQADDLPPKLGLSVDDALYRTLERVFERAGNFKRGSITGFFTVLVEGDDFNEPICDAVRGILDGHIVLSRRLADAGHYPAIDILQSVSRLISRVATPEQREAARKVREAMAIYQQSEDLIQLGAYAAGSNPRLDASIRLRNGLMDFLRQDAHATSPRAETLERLDALAAALA